MRSTLKINDDPRGNDGENTISAVITKPLYLKDLIEVTELLATTDVITGQIYNCSMGEILSY